MGKQEIPGSNEEGKVNIGRENQHYPITQTTSFSKILNKDIKFNKPEEDS
ncbi:XRE family transcriptional regulator [Sesbania bispinosa]|nr:XRE family transcriptional regulator [Sesbania bispinosa]